MAQIVYGTSDTRNNEGTTQGGSLLLFGLPLVLGDCNSSKFGFIGGNRIHGPPDCRLSCELVISGTGQPVDVRNKYDNQAKDPYNSSIPKGYSLTSVSCGGHAGLLPVNIDCIHRHMSHRYILLAPRGRQYKSSALRTKNSWASSHQIKPNFVIRLLCICVTIKQV